MIEAEARALGLPTSTVTFLLATAERPANGVALVASPNVASEVVLNSFTDAREALHAAFEARRGGVGRWAVHTGEVIDDAPTVGPTLDRGLALLAIGGDGHILVSASTAVCVENRLPAGTRLVDRGIHRLRDLGRPEHVWQLSSDGLPAEGGELRSLTVFRHNLPTQLTPLIGRRADIGEIGRLGSAERLVTIIGAGGVGKTRVALAVAAASMERFPGGVWWVELAAVTTGPAVARAALAVLNAAEAPGVPGSVQLAAALGNEGALLALDNCEHLVADCAELVAGLLAANPSVTVLATSREPLGVPGEVTWRLRSLAAPELDGPLDPVTLYRGDATRLFIERAVRAQPSLIVDAEGGRSIGQICHRLDGIPLAIELASARCRHVRPAQISRELDDRFRVLTGGARTAVARQQTLAASVEWSHARLDEAERRTFRRLGVFVGPFPIEAAQAVVAGPGDIQTNDVLDVVTRLVDKSLVVADEGVHGATRYRLLETLRAFAVERAAEAGELDDLRDCNARWWASWLDEHFHELHTDAMLDRVDEAHGNLVAALAWSVRDPELGLSLLARVLRSWWVLADTGDAMPAIDQLLTAENAIAHARSWIDAAIWAGQLVMTFRGEDAGFALLDLSERTAAAIDDEYRLTLARWSNRGTHLADRVEELAHERGDQFIEARAVLDQSTLLINADPQHADDHLARVRELARTERSSSLRDELFHSEACVARDVGELTRGIGRATSLAHSRSTMKLESSVWLLSSIGLLAKDEEALRLAVQVAERRLPNVPGSSRDLEQARTRHRALTKGERASVTPNLDTIPWMNGSMWFVCREAIDAGEPDRALAVVRAQAPPTPFGQAVLAVIEGAVSGDDDHWHEALRLAAEKGLRPIAVDALEGLAVGAARGENWTDCLRLFAAAQRLRDETGYRWRFCFERDVVEPARAAALAALGAPLQEDPLEWHEAAAYAARARGRRQRPRHGWESLTPTELQVAELVADGQTNPQIAQRLLMGRATVKTHLEHVFTKLGVRSRAELAALVTRQTQR